MHEADSFQGVMSLQFNQDKTKKSVEMISNLDSSIEVLLQRWKRNNDGLLPQSLFFCRDGVGDAQLTQVLDEELPQIRNACRKVYAKGSVPAIVILVTQKRHIVRFYEPAEGQNKAFNNGNPVPGFVVDSGIVCRDFDDFYMVSHKTLQGTSVPAHHIRVYDERKCNTDDLQALVNGLAYIFGRSTTSISETAPARYAHLLCERAKYHLHDAYFPPPDDNDDYDSRVHFSGEHCIHADLRETMYFV